MKKLLISSVAALILVTAACSTSWIQTAEQYITVLIPAIEDVVGIVQLAGVKGVSSTAMGTVSEYAQQATVDLQGINTLLTQYNAANATTTIQKINVAANDAKQNLNLILPALHITDPGTISKVTSAVNLATNTVEQLQALMPGVSTTPTLGRRGRPPSPGDLQQDFNSIFSK
jgi:DNA uptake protein ComE-like DNA-binding protein